jgi:hypothetical protein
MEAAAAGVGVELLEACLGGAPEFLGEDAFDERAGDRLGLLLEQPQLGGDLGGDQIGPGGQELAELDVDAAGLFQRSPQRAAGRGPSRLGGVPPSEAGKPGAGGDHGDLGVATPAGQPSSQCGERVGERLSGRGGQRP